MGSLASGRGGISPETIALIERLLEEGISDRAIARRVDVGRSVVAIVRRGESPGRTNDEGDPVERCGGCGGLVTMPCRACSVMARKARRVVVFPTIHTVFALQRSQAAPDRPADRRTVCGPCGKLTTDLYFVDPATNRLTVEGRCPDCQELAVARSLRPAAAPAPHNDRPGYTTDFHIPRRQKTTARTT